MYEYLNPVLGPSARAHILREASSTAAAAS